MKDNHQPPKFYTIGEAHKRKRGRPPGQPGYKNQQRKTGSSRDPNATKEDRQAMKERRAAAEAAKPTDIRAAAKSVFKKSLERRGWMEAPEKRSAFQLNACFKDVYTELFQPPDDVTMPNNRQTLIDIDNVDEVREAAETYIDICRLYGIMPSASGFTIMSGIAHNAFYNWLNGTSRAKNRDGVTITHMEIAKTIQRSRQEYVLSALGQTPVGNMAIANNDRETGLEWQKKQLQDAAEILTPQIAAQDIAQRLAARTAGSLEAPQKPRKLLAPVIPYDDSSDNDGND